jgi:hypothetical protein
MERLEEALGQDSRLPGMIDVECVLSLALGVKQRWQWRPGEPASNQPLTPDEVLGLAFGRAAELYPGEGELAEALRARDARALKELGVPVEVWFHLEHPLSSNVAWSEWLHRAAGWLEQVWEAKLMRALARTAGER